MSYIEREMEHGANGRLIFKINSLMDKKIIQALYRASQAGVKIDLIVRGICCLRPGIKGVSENILVLSIVGRFLEQARIYYFYNDGDPEIYVGSADLMPRNIDRRIEVVFPIEDEALRSKIVNEILDVQLNDTVKGHLLQKDGSYVSVASLLLPEDEKLNSQLWFLNGHAPKHSPAVDEALSPV